MIRVLVVDDHPVFRSGLAHLLTAQEDLHVAGIVGDGAQVGEAVRRHRPDVILMDLSMPGVDGIQATRDALAACPDVKVIALTAFVDNARVLGVLDAGAIGYLLKDADARDLVAGVRAAAAGQSPMSSAAARALVGERRRAVEDVHLTPREAEVLALLAEGLTNRRIAGRLGISEATVKAHISRILGAIGVQDRTQAAIWVHRHGTAPPRLAARSAGSAARDAGRGP